MILQVVQALYDLNDCGDIFITKESAKVQAKKNNYCLDSVRSPWVNHFTSG